MRIARAETEHASAQLELDAERELAVRRIVSRISLRQSELAEAIRAVLVPAAQAAE